jgi:ABC-type lipoprotein export system ATPase subunit
VVVNDPAVLMVDEPAIWASMLRRTHRRSFDRSMKMENTIVMVTHDPDLSPFADEVFRMDRGGLSAYETCP